MKTKWKTLPVTQLRHYATPASINSGRLVILLEGAISFVLIKQLVLFGPSYGFIFVF